LFGCNDYSIVGKKEPALLKKVGLQIQAILLFVRFHLQMDVSPCVRIDIASIEKIKTGALP